MKKEMREGEHERMTEEFGRSFGEGGGGGGGLAGWDWRERGRGNFSGRGGRINWLRESIACKKSCMKRRMRKEALGGGNLFSVHYTMYSAPTRRWHKSMSAGGLLLPHMHEGRRPSFLRAKSIHLISSIPPPQTIHHLPDLSIAVVWTVFCVLPYACTESLKKMPVYFLVRPMFAVRLNFSVYVAFQSQLY